LVELLDGYDAGDVAIIDVLDSMVDASGVGVGAEEVPSEGSFGSAIN
jgi:hypothetical protein